MVSIGLRFDRTIPTQLTADDGCLPVDPSDAFKIFGKTAGQQTAIKFVLGKIAGTQAHFAARFGLIGQPDQRLRQRAGVAWGNSATALVLLNHVG